MIGRLQRFAMDFLYETQVNVFPPARATGKKIAVVGSGAAGLSCAGELARRGHSVTLFEKRALPGGLSTYGIIALREPLSIAIAETEMIRRLGVEFRTGVELCQDLGLADLTNDFDAVFLSIGLGDTPSLNIPGEEHILDGLAYVEQSKIDPSQLPRGNNVVVIGAGNTAIDCATIAKRIGAEKVIIVYRRSADEVSAYQHEVDFVRNEGVEFLFLSQPAAVAFHQGQVSGLECLLVQLGGLDASGRPSPVQVPGSEFLVSADLIIKAIGQQKSSLAKALGLRTEAGFIAVNDAFETSIGNVFAGGDCIRSAGACSTVMAVEDGKLAAFAIHNRLEAN
jgi:glutamate synthase (NADPH/NADH) small chain